MYIAFSKSTSPTGKALQAALRAKRLKAVGTPWKRKKMRYKPSVLVWGPVRREFPNSRVICNGPVMDKLEQYYAFTNNDIPHPDFTTDISIAKVWSQTGTVLARKLLNSHSGKGIEVFSGQEAPVYTKYYKKDVEIRVHLWYNNVILVTQKRRRNGVNADVKIRNHRNGYIYSDKISDWVDLDWATGLARRAVQAVGYNWGAVDIICRKAGKEPYIVLEVNSAPGLTGRTLEAYSEAIKNARA